jgi:urease accessory protein
MQPEINPGEGEVWLERVGESTVATRLRAASPLRLFAMRGDDGAAWVLLSSLGGGLVTGDALSLSARVGPDAVGLFTTQASTKAYRSERGVTQRSEIHAAGGSLCAWVPDPLVCFARSRVAQQTHAHLAPGASLVLLDSFTSGRSLRGERWAFDRLDARLQVTADGAPIVDESLLLDPAHGPIAARMGRFDLLATLVLLGPLVEPHAAAIERAIAATPLGRPDAVIESASRAGPALVLRLAASSTAAGLTRLRERLSFLDPLVGGRVLGRRG